MRKSIYTYAILLAMPVIALMTSCEPRSLTEEDVIVRSEKAADCYADGTLYNINDFLDKFMTENGNFLSDSTQYRSRAKYGSLYLFSIDTLPKDGPGIYLRGRVATDDYGGNFYKALVIQQVTDWETGEAIDQQCLRISVDLGSASGMYHQGQEILIRCNGLSVGRYANQPQLCIPSNNNNIFASSAEEKVGWAPGRIPSSHFRNATKLIGKPDKSKLVYDELTLAELQTKFLKNYADVVGARKVDGRLIKVKDVHFSGEYDALNVGPTACTRYDLKDPTNPDKGNPEVDQNACCFGPTTGNVGFPQSRYVRDAGNTNKVLISTSEYARYAYYYLPGAKHMGSIKGIFGYYMDNGKYAPDGGEWSITPCILDDILPECQVYNENGYWIPTEWKKGVAQPED